MTITPTEATAPPTIGTTGTAGATDPSSAGDFLAAILQALAPDADQMADGTSAPPQPATPDADPSALGLVVPPGLAAPLLPVPPVLVAATAPGHANVAPGAAEVPTDLIDDIRMSDDAAAVPPTAPAAAPTTVQPPATGAAPAAASAPVGGPDRGSGASPSTADAALLSDRADQALPDPGTVAAVATTTRRPADTDRSEPGAVSPQPVLTTSVPTSSLSTTGVSPAEPATAAAPQHVTRQVFPEVSRLVSRGDGTHRITLDLNPESLGEVRVVMTVRDGAVHVRFAAGHEAGRALLDGSAELNRLLGAAGASETRIVVRELSAASLPTTGTADGTPAGPDPGLGSDGHRPQDEHAGTRADTPATDGTHDRTTAGANPPRSIQPVTRTRTAGVDVTM